MAQHRKPYSARRARTTSRRVNDSTLGSHVERRSHERSRQPVSRNPRVSRHDSNFTAAIARKARIRRIATIVVVALVAVGLSVGAGVLVFRSLVGGEFALQNSDAKSVLVEAKKGEPTYTLITADVGAIAKPLDNGRPDIILLARFDEEAKSLALINIPVGLQITSDNQSNSLVSIAQSGDAALIKAISQFAKVDISHFIKVDQAGFAGIIQALGGIEVDVEQVIDDPHAGSTYIYPGTQTLDAETAFTYLRATNVKYGENDQLTHQLTFATKLLEKIFSKEGNFATRLESIGKYFQTDYALGQLETINASIGGTSAQDIVIAVLPGYFPSVTNVTGNTGSRYIGSASDMATLISDLDNGREPTVGLITQNTTADPSSFTVDVQNGTTVVGAASAAATLLKNAGFNVGEVGNADQPVYDETLVVYKNGDEGLARANAVINTIGAGRAVQINSYYSFNADVLLILGADNKPVS